MRNLKLEFQARPGITTRAFTMIEIAISLAVIGFAMVAIIGVLPTGMSVQRENREETIINQDATVIINAIRNGERGIDDLTNYVTAITNFATVYSGARGGTPVQPPWGYTFERSSMNPQFRLTNGFRIVGLLSTPKYYLLPSPPRGPQYFVSNYVVAYVRSFSGPASEKAPQTNATVRELALSYRLIAEVAPYQTNYYDPVWTNFQDPTINGSNPDTAEIARRLGYYMTVTNLQNNFHDLRLTFRWPLLPDGSAGNGRQVFRTAVSGPLRPYVEPDYRDPSRPTPEFTLYFFEPQSFVKGAP